MTAASTSTTTPLQRFYGALTPEMRRQIAALPTLLEDYRNDVIVFTARKAVCVADSLYRLHQWGASGEFTSTRALDGRRDVFSGRRVLIVDDVAASGRTIRTTADAVRGAGAISVDCFAFSTEGSQQEWGPRLGVNFVGGYVESSISESLMHTRSLIEAFRALPRPYNMDWPIYTVTTAFDPDALLDTGWRISNYRSPDPAAPITLELGHPLTAELRGLLPAWLLSVLTSASLAKARIYPVPRPQTRGTKFFAVPIVATGGMNDQELVATADRLADFAGVERFAVAGSSKETYRALQYLLGELVGQILHVSGRFASATDDLGTQFLFAEPARSAVRAAQYGVRATTRQLLEGALEDGIRPVVVREARDEWDDLQLAFAAESFLSEGFLTRYMQSEEYQLRRLLRQTAEEGERGAIVERLIEIDRSTDGASLSFADLERDLRVRLREAGMLERADVPSLVTSFLDDAIDAGEVVPDLLPEAGCVVRRFRAGEVIAFQENEQALFEGMLHAYCSQRGDRELTGDLLQKLMVGFASFLLGVKRLTDLRGASASRAESVEKLQRRYHIRGAVLDAPANEFVANRGAPRSAQILLSRGVIHEVSVGVDARTGEERKRYVVPEQRRLHGDPRDHFFGTTYGRVMAEVVALRDESGNQLLDDDALGRLVTLSDTTAQAHAIIADADIASRLMPDARANPGRARTSKAAAAINNGLAKARWTLYRRSEARVDELLERLANAQQAALAEGRAPAIDLGDAGSVIETFRPRDRDSIAMELIDAGARWCRDALLWLIGVEQTTLADVPTKEERKALGKALNNNKGLSEVSQALISESGGARGHLCRLLDDLTSTGTRGEELLRTVELAGEELDDDVRDHLMRRGHGLVYEHSLKPATVRTSCLLVHVPAGLSVKIGKRPGLTREEFEISAPAGTILERFNRVVTGQAGFDPEETVGRIFELIGSDVPSPIYVDSMPPHFQYDVEGSVFRPMAPLLTLIERAVEMRPLRGGFVVAAPEGSTTLAARQARTSASSEQSVEIAGVKWRIAALAFPAREIEAAGSSRAQRVRASDLQRPSDDLSPRDSVSVSLEQGNVYINAGQTEKFGTVEIEQNLVYTFSQRSPEIAEELRRFIDLLTTQQATLERAGDIAVLEEALEAAQADNESRFLRVAKRASRTTWETARQAGTDIAVQYLEKKGLLPGIPPGR
jgi:hypothetical protein